MLHYYLDLRYPISLFCLHFHCDWRAVILNVIKTSFLILCHTYGATWMSYSITSKEYGLIPTIHSRSLVYSKLFWQYIFDEEINFLSIRIVTNVTINVRINIDSIKIFHKIDIHSNLEKETYVLKSFSILRLVLLQLIELVFISVI